MLSSSLERKVGDIRAIAAIITADPRFGIFLVLATTQTRVYVQEASVAQAAAVVDFMLVNNSKYIL